MKLSKKEIDLKMAKKCMTITSLAEAYGVSRNRMQVIFNQREVTPICAGRLAKALECDVAEIIE